MENELFKPAAPAPAVAIPPRRGKSALGDAFSRFAKNRASLTAAVILALLLLFALLTPFFSPYTPAFRDGFYRGMPPIFFRNTRLSGTQGVLDYHLAMGQEAGLPAVSGWEKLEENNYRLTLDAYRRVGFWYLDLTPAEFAALQDYQNRTGHQVCYPLPKNYNTFYPAVGSSANLWYKLSDDGPYSSGTAAFHDETGAPILSPNYLESLPDGSYTSLRLEQDPGTWVYGAKNQTGWRVRVLYAEYFRYRNGFSPRFFLGTNQHGQDIAACLSSGARLSILLAVSVSAINLLIGVLFGAVEGFFGGKTDLILERFSDILRAVPFIVVATLFQLHLAQKAGPVLSLLFSFVLTGWIGIAARVRTQFYRFKNAEYVLCARTLGAGNGRLIFRHILPNAIGTIITGAVLLIPGVIFSESMLSYLGIVNLEAENMTSIGTMLAGGRAYLGTQPHILAFPAIFLALLEISFNLFGNGLRDAFNPTLRGQEG